MNNRKHVSAGEIWETVYKVSSGNEDPFYDVWINPGTNDGGPECSSNPSIKCSSTFKSSRVDTWDAVRQVMGVLLWLIKMCHTLIISTTKNNYIFDVNLVV